VGFAESGFAKDLQISNLQGFAICKGLQISRCNWQRWVAKRPM